MGEAESRGVNMVMPFGRYKGQELATLPAEYLTWLAGLELREPLRTAVTAEVERRNAEQQIIRDHKDPKQLAEKAKPLPEHGEIGNGRSRDSVSISKGKRDASYLAARIARDAPDVLERGAWTVGGDPQEIIAGDFPISSRKR